MRRGVTPAAAVTSAPPDDDPAGLRAELRDLAAAGLHRELRPLDGPAAVYIERCRQHAANPAGPAPISPF